MAAVATRETRRGGACELPCPRVAAPARPRGRDRRGQRGDGGEEPANAARASGAALTTRPAQLLVEPAFGLSLLDALPNSARLA